MNEGSGHVDIRHLADLGQDIRGVLAGEIADIDPHRAFLGDHVQRVAARDPAQVDRRAIEHLRGLPREWERLDGPEHIHRLQHRVVAQPRR